MTDNTYAPRFEHTAGIASDIEEIERQRWLVDNMLLMPKYEEWIQRSVWIARVAATTAIEQLGIGEEAVSELAKRSPAGSLDDAEQANLNALRAYEFVDFVSDQDDSFMDELVIRELNRVFLLNTKETNTPGVYRKGQNQVYKFTPPNAGDVPDLMRGFALWLRDDSNEIHPILKAGLAHLHFVAIHPFWDGNGRTARALLTMILQRSGWGFKKLISLETEFYNPRDDYLTAIEQATDTEFQEDYDATVWLEYYTSALLRAVDRLAATLTDWKRVVEDAHGQFKKFGLSARETDGLVYAVHKKQIKRSDYVEITGVSPITASRDLAHMVKVGALIPEGNTRNRVYIPAGHQQS